MSYAVTVGFLPLLFWTRTVSTCLIAAAHAFTAKRPRPDVASTPMHVHAHAADLLLPHPGAQHAPVSSSPLLLTHTQAIRAWHPPAGLFAYSAQDSKVAQSADCPQRPGEPECSYYMKTGVCAFGSKCKFHHPPRAAAAPAPSSLSFSPTPSLAAGTTVSAKPTGEYPQRPGEPKCAVGAGLPLDTCSEVWS